jgi:hypothetical protein
MQEILTATALRTEPAAFERRILLSTGSMLVIAVGILSILIVWR